MNIFKTTQKNFSLLWKKKRWSIQRRKNAKIHRTIIEKTEVLYFFNKRKN
jgi:hypothetical protein